MTLEKVDWSFKSKKRGKSQYIEKKYVALLRLDIKPQHIQYLIGFSLTGTSAVVWSEILKVLSGTYEGEQDEDEEGEDGAAGAGDGSEHGAGRQEDGGGGQEEGQTLRQPSPGRASHPK